MFIRKPASPKLSQRWIVFGFDSAWTDRNDGAICSISSDGGKQIEFRKPELCRFKGAFDYIDLCKDQYPLIIVAIDQPTIVKNEKGMREVEKIAGSVINSAGGGVQPSNKNKNDMFGDEAPIRSFISALDPSHNFDDARKSDSGTFLIEVYPALALAGWNPSFSQKKGAPKYNPKNKKFKICDWIQVCTTVSQIAKENKLHELSEWVDDSSSNPKPSKADQDKLDSVKSENCCKFASARLMTA